MRSENTSVDSLPNELPGTVHRQYVRCGRPECRCADGELHGPYYYRFFWGDGKMRKRYVRPGRLKETTAACKRRQERERNERSRRHANAQLIRDFKSVTRDIEQMMAERRQG